MGRVARVAKSPGGENMLWAILLIVGFVIGLFVGYLYFGGKSTTTKPEVATEAPGTISLQKLENDILKTYEDSRVSNDVDKFAAAQLVSAYFGLLYVYNLKPDPNAFVAAAALDVYSRDIVTLSYRYVMDLPDDPCYNLVKAAVAARTQYFDEARDYLGRAAACDAPGSDEVREYINKLLPSS